MRWFWELAIEEWSCAAAGRLVRWVEGKERGGWCIFGIVSGFGRMSEAWESG